MGLEDGRIREQGEEERVFPDGEAVGAKNSGLAGAHAVLCKGGTRWGKWIGSTF